MAKSICFHGYSTIKITVIPALCIIQVRHHNAFILHKTLQRFHVAVARGTLLEILKYSIRLCLCRQFQQFAENTFCSFLLISAHFPRTQLPAIIWGAHTQHTATRFFRGDWALVKNKQFSWAFSISLLCMSEAYLSLIFLAAMGSSFSQINRWRKLDLLFGGLLVLWAWLVQLPWPQCAHWLDKVLRSFTGMPSERACCVEVKLRLQLRLYMYP